MGKKHLSLEQKRQAIVKAALKSCGVTNAKMSGQLFAALALDDNLLDGFRKMVKSGTNVVSILIPLEEGLATMKVPTEVLRLAISGRDRFSLETQVMGMYSHFCG